MQIVNVDVLIAAARKHRDAASALNTWREVVEDAHWGNLAELRQAYPAADGVSVASGAIITIFNIRGNNYRLLTRISFKSHAVQIVALLTHAEYDKQQWKRRL